QFGPKSVALDYFGKNQITLDSSAIVAPAKAAENKSGHDYELLGDLHLRQKQYQQALDAFERALKMKPDLPDLPEVYRKAAEARMQLGELKEAKWLLDKAITAREEKKERSTLPAGAAQVTKGEPPP